MSPPERPRTRDRARAVVCDLSGRTGLTGADMGTADALALHQLAVRRQGGQLELHGVCPRLRELLALSGLSDVLAVEQVVGQAEQPEQVGAEEVGDRGDPAT